MTVSCKELENRTFQVPGPNKPQGGAAFLDGLFRTRTN